MKKFALSGISIAHSKSPELFRAAYQSNPDYSYELMTALSAKDAISQFCANELCGMNITAPFKNDILKYADWLSEEVKAIGAANVILSRNGKLHAYNTDTVGVSDSFIHYGIKLENEKAIVLGCGGAGQAAVYALKKAGVKVWIANRTEEKAEQLATKFQVLFLPISRLDSQLKECNLLVNTLPTDADLYRHFNLNKHNILLDANYSDYPLREKAATANAFYISGLSWILYQAIPSYFLFTGKMPDIKAMKQLLGL